MMTPTKRKRIYVERGNPLPGAMISFRCSTKMYDSPPTDHSTKLKLACVGFMSSYGMVLTLNERLESAFIMVDVDRKGKLTFGWIAVQDIASL